MVSLRTVTDNIKAPWGAHPSRHRRRPLLPVVPPARQKAAAAEARRDPYLHAGRARHRLGSGSNGVGRARGQVAPKPVPTSGRQLLALPATQQRPTYHALRQ